MKTTITLILALFLIVAMSYSQDDDGIDESGGLSAYSGFVIDVTENKDQNYTATIASTYEDPIAAIITMNYLKTPEAFMVLEKGTEISLVGYWMEEQMMVKEFYIIVQKEKFKEICETPLSKDSVLIENLVEFETFGEKKTNLEPAVRFTLRVTNKGKNLIPALSPINIGARILNTEQWMVEFIVNGISGGLGIYNGSGYAGETISFNGVSETSEGSTLTKNAGIRMNGDTITVQWKYMGILSEKVTIDLKNKTIINQQPMLGLRTVIYKVTDLNSAKEWYAEAFKTKPYFDEPFYVGFNIGDYELGLQPEEAVSEKSTNVLVYWEVDEVQREYDRLIKMGATSHEDPENVGGKIMTATLKDPWGNVIGLIYNSKN